MPNRRRCEYMVIGLVWVLCTKRGLRTQVVCAAPPALREGTVAEEPLYGWFFSPNLYENSFYSSLSGLKKTAKSCIQTLDPQRHWKPSRILHNRWNLQLFGVEKKLCMEIPNLGSADKLPGLYSQPPPLWLESWRISGFTLLVPISSSIRVLILKICGLFSNISWYWFLT